MKKKGFTLVELLVVIAIIAMLLAILMPALGKVRALAYRLMCGTNLGGIGKAMAVYSNDYQEQYPVMGGSGCTWQTATTGTSNFTGGGMTWDKDITSLSTGQGPSYVTAATITSSLYLLVKYADVSAAQFVCKASTQKKLDMSLIDAPSATTIKDLTQLWDFGPLKGSTKPTTVWQFCSYSYQQPYAVGAAGGTAYPLSASSQAGLAMLADRNPWFADDGTFVAADTATPPKTGPYMLTTSDFDTTTGALTKKDNAKLANSKAHNQDGQNVLFGDNHVSFENTPLVGIEEDNIYTTWLTAAPTNFTDKKIGMKPVARTGSATSGGCLPQADTDSFLAN